MAFFFRVSIHAWKVYIIHPPLHLPELGSSIPCKNGIPPFSAWKWAQVPLHGLLPWVRFHLRFQHRDGLCFNGTDPSSQGT